jgi:hypothetical protein
MLWTMASSWFATRLCIRQMTDQHMVLRSLEGLRELSIEVRLSDTTTVRPSAQSIKDMTQMVWHAEVCAAPHRS